MTQVEATGRKSLPHQPGVHNTLCRLINSSAFVFTIELISDKAPRLVWQARVVPSKTTKKQNKLWLSCAKLKFS